MFRYCYQPFSRVARQWRGIPKQLSTNFQRTETQLSQCGADQLQQPIQVGVDPQRVRLPAQQSIEQNQVLAMAQ